ncbi:response regulator [Candidatus Woesearchaeota archaeon]|nr:response regulator [Candidatus Woesearchaeota archaeon]
MTKTIIVADDDKGIRDLISEMLEDEGHIVITAFDGKEALNIYNTEKTDALVTDGNMPYMSGFSLTEEIRKVDPEYPIVMASARFSEDDDEYEQIAFKSGVNACVRKPDQMIDIPKTLERVLAERYD